MQKLKERGGRDRAWVRCLVRCLVASLLGACFGAWVDLDQVRGKR